MAKILVKNSVTSGSAPAGLSLGEMAINITDKKIFIGNAVEAAVAIYDPNSHVLSFNGSTGAVVFNNYVTSINGKTGDVTGISASTVMLGSTNINATRYLVFAATAGDQSLLIDNVTTPLSYNPNTGTVGAKIFDATVGANQVKLDASIGNISVTDGVDASYAVSYGFEHSGPTPHYFYNTTPSPSTFIVTPALRVSDGDYDAIYGPSTWGYTFPAANGTSGQAMFTDGGGQLYWGSASGVISFNGATGAVVFNNYVTSINGATGAVTNVARTNQGNTFSVRQVMDAGITTSTLFVTSGATFNSAPSSDGGYRITSNAINALTGTTYSLLTSDDGKVITWSNASGVTLTVPSGLPVGFNTTVIQIGAGAVGITGSGTTLNSFEGKLRTAGQHTAVSIISYSSNIFNIAGGLTG